MSTATHNATPCSSRISRTSAVPPPPAREPVRSGNAFRFLVDDMKTSPVVGLSSFSARHGSIFDSVPGVQPPSARKFHHGYMLYTRCVLLLDGGWSRQVDQCMPGPRLFFFFSFLFHSLSTDVSCLEMFTQALLEMITLSIRRMIGDHRDSALRGFDVYLGATTVTLLNIRNGGIPKNTL
ncbi:hypothetical protein B0H13DRAFT_1900580 [Mycena leptocephala]|nr:hypothetical protein B0H13DRAFT_1900580 [Mycena leptocephala]